MSYGMVAGVRRHLAGRIENLPDARDLPHSHELVYGAAPFTPSASYSLRAALDDLGIYDQGSIGSCVFNALCRALRALRVRDGVDPYDLSRLFAYYSCRCWRDGRSPDEDPGAQIRGAVQSARRFGVCTEALFPYDDSKLAVCPPPEAVHDAYDHQALAYGSTSTLREIQTSIERDRCPVIIGMKLPQYFLSDECSSSGVLPYRPQDPLVGGHAMLVEGWETLQSGTVMLEVANSWGTGWGDSGYVHIDSRYLDNGQLCDGTAVRSREP